MFTATAGVLEQIPHRVLQYLTTAVQFSHHYSASFTLLQRLTHNELQQLGAAQRTQQWGNSTSTSEIMEEPITDAL